MPFIARGPLPRQEPPGPGVGGFLKSIVQAPGSEFGPTPLAMPGMVFQKVGVPALRGLLSRQVEQIIPKARQIGLSLASDVGQTAQRAEIKPITKLVQRNTDKLLAAQTGKPITLVGFRAEPARGGPVPGRGTFFSSIPSGARSFGERLAKQSVRGSIRKTQFARQGEIRAKRTDVIKFTNPLVTARSQFGLVSEMVQEASRAPGRLSPSLVRSGSKLLESLRRERPASEAAFTKLDKWLARALTSQGHDGIIYQANDEIVDLAGAVTKRAAKP